MSNQTLQRSTSKRRTRAKSSSRAGNFSRQTARLDGRRDGKPLIFGWGGHLTRTEKARLQQRTAYGFFGLVIVAVVGVFLFGLFQQNYLVPNATFVSVNGKSVSQDTYRKVLAYEAQDAWNHLQAEISQQTALQPKVQAGDATATTQNTVLTQQIQSDEANYQQSAITQSTSDKLVEDQLIQQGAQRFEQQQHVPAATFTPTTKEINDALAAFKKAFPAGQSYGKFLSTDNVTDADVRFAIALQLRRDHMQTYLASLLTSPTLQVHLRHIQTNTVSSAQKILDSLKKDSSDANWSTLAKQDSLDADNKDKGGDMGFVAPGTGDTIIGDWAYAAGRKVHDLSPVLKDTDGTYDVVQVLEIDPNRAVDASTLTAAKNNALDHWISGQRYSTTNHVTTPSSDMLTATRNMPKTPDLNAALPQESAPPAGAGSTGALPGDLTGQPTTP